MGPRLIRICYFNTWADRLEEVTAYLARVGQLDLRSLVSRPSDAALLQKARLDCDWYAENARCFAAVQHPGLEFLPAWTVGRSGLVELAKRPRVPGEERWLVTMAHQPQSLGAAAGKAFELLARAGVRHLFYAFDEASRCMPCFREIAPYLSALIHDEDPLDPTAAACLPPHCATVHRSWVANVVPGTVAFQESPEDMIYFLGSEMGLTPHRRRQLDFLRQRFPGQVVASCDHSTSIVGRAAANRFKVAFCPEGRKFTTPAMRTTHTDRPFWAGCLGMVPVCEDSQLGGRLEDLKREKLIVRYRHGDLESLASACEEALALPSEQRRGIYTHFNACETIGTVVADTLSKCVVGERAAAA